MDVTLGRDVVDVEGLYRLHRTDLVRLAFLATGDQGLAEEIVQDTFVRLHERPPQMRDSSRVDAYLRSAVLNRCRSGLRRLGAGRRATDTVASRQHAAPPPGSPADRAMQGAERTEVMAAIRKLPRRQRDVVLLRYYLDLSEAEIADTLDISRGTVKSSSHRALAALAPTLEALR